VLDSSWLRSFADSASISAIDAEATELRSTLRGSIAGAFGSGAGNNRTVRMYRFDCRIGSSDADIA
jgi:hypothetical protein